MSLNKPATRDHQSVQNFLENNGSGYEESTRPLLQEDTDFVYHKEDLVTLRPGRESAWLDACVERVLKFCHCKAIQVRTLPFLFQVVY